jgi:hypothetical protein
MHALAVAADQSLGAREHLLRGASRKGQQEYFLCRDATLDQMRDAIDEGAGLPGSSAGDYQERTVRVCCRGCLLGIQFCGEIA